jgi:hypothetical protein
MRLIALTVFLALAGCNQAGGFGGGATVTLYRNSPVDYSMRIHWGTFDAQDGVNYNLSNCQMAARLLNANVTALAKKEGRRHDSVVGFWCEVGRYKESGMVPMTFQEEYPTDAS